MVRSFLFSMTGTYRLARKTVDAPNGSLLYALRMAARFDRLSLLQTFVRIAERRSLSGAARDLGTSQPSVSRQLAALESRLGVVLVRRTTHDVALTQDGLTLLTDARGLLAEWEAIEDRYTKDQAIKGVIRVFAPLALGQSLLVKAAAQFLAEHPYVKIDWRLSDDPIRFAEEGCDCWIKVGPIPDDSLVVRKLALVERLVVGTPECLERHKNIALDMMPWLTLGPFEGNRIDLFKTDVTPVSFNVDPKWASDNIFAVYEAVVQGVGIAIMPHWFVASDLASGRLANVSSDLRAASLPINLAIAPGTRRPARVEQFCAAMEVWCRENLVL